MGVEVNNESGVEVDISRIIDLVECALKFMNMHPKIEVAILLVDMKFMERLHIEWMGEAGATDVLSFPMDELSPGRGDSEGVEGILGDIVLCPDFARVQAESAGNSLMDELLLLTTHGFLHLLGYDHGDLEERTEMFGVQSQILEKFFDGGQIPKISVDSE